MSSPSERRTNPDRRKAVRGGRRPQDRPGSTPLVLVVGAGGNPRRESETILRELKFAVAPAANLSEALRVVEGLHPDLIVAQPEEASRLRATGSVTVPIVEYDSQDPSEGRLVERLREALRKRR
ncbi:MAG TPA: response regulator [Vicinamibacterales bacterium]|nr:response regulator [Vicinamibacterales bacterium]